MMSKSNMAEIPIWRESQYGGKSNMADILQNKANIDNFVFRRISTTQL